MNEQMAEQNRLREHSASVAEGRLTTSLRSFVAGRSPDGQHVLLGGLGAFGVGEMWVPFETRHEQYPGWDSAPMVAYA